MRVDLAGSDSGNSNEAVDEGFVSAEFDEELDPVESLRPVVLMIASSGAPSPAPEKISPPKSSPAPPIPLNNRLPFIPVFSSPPSPNPPIPPIPISFFRCTGEGEAARNNINSAAVSDVAFSS